jgi:hypothetical protein
VSLCVIALDFQEVDVKGATGKLTPLANHRLEAPAGLHARTLAGSANISDIVNSDSIQFPSPKQPQRVLPSVLIR